MDHPLGCATLTPVPAMSAPSLIDRIARLTDAVERRVGPVAAELVAILGNVECALALWDAHLVELWEEIVELRRQLARHSNNSSPSPRRYA